MSSDYIPRLRRELLRAGETTHVRRRRPGLARGLAPLAAATAALAAMVVVGVLASPAGQSDETAIQRAADGASLTYRVAPASAAAAEQTAKVMRARLAAMGIDDAHVSVSAGGASLTVAAPASARADVSALTQRGRVAFYDWERSVLGPGGTPAPADESVTGGPDAGRAAGLTRPEAEARAARVPGAHVVRAPDFAGDYWFVLGGEPGVSDADIARARPSSDPRTHEPIVLLEFTGPGETAFTAMTQDVARRGADRAADGASALEANQHFAIVIDDQIVSVPYIEFRMAPGGLSGAAGAQILGGLTERDARAMAAIVTTGPLPAELSSPTRP